MDIKKFANLTVRDIFTEMLGKEKAEVVLTSIQDEYDKGTRGKELQHFAENQIKMAVTDKSLIGLAIAVASVIIFHVADEPARDDYNK